MRLGLMTYSLARSWDLDTIIGRCLHTGFEGDELRMTHAHGVRTTFEGAGVKIAGLGSAFEFQSPEPIELRRNIDGTKAYVRLAHDVSAPGVKVRPNVLPDGVPVGNTLRQIGESLAECGEFAQGMRVQIRLEVQGPPTQEVPKIRSIIDYVDHGNVFVCWNSNATDVVKRSIVETFSLVEGRIGLALITELYNPDYPYRDLFRRLTASGYDDFCLAEIP